MTNPTIEQAIAARDAARNRYNNLSVDVPPGIEKAVYLEYEAAKARLDGLFEEERRSFAESKPRLTSGVTQTCA